MTASWPPARRWRRSAACCACCSWPSTAPAWTSSRSSAPSRSSRCSSARSSPSRRPISSGCWSSSIANAGYLLVGALAFSADGLSASMFYLVAYGFAVLAAFGIVTLVRDEEGEATHLSRWAGLGRRSPLVAGVFTFLLLAFAGIPLTSGFTSKQPAVLAGPRGWHQLAGGAGHRGCRDQHGARLPVPAGRGHDVAVRAERQYRVSRSPVPSPRPPSWSVCSPRCCWASSCSRCSTWPTAPPSSCARERTGGAVRSGASGGASRAQRGWVWHRGDVVSSPSARVSRPSTATGSAVGITLVDPALEAEILASLDTVEAILRDAVFTADPVLSDAARHLIDAAANGSARSRSPSPPSSVTAASPRWRSRRSWSSSPTWRRCTTTT